MLKLYWRRLVRLSKSTNAVIVQLMHGPQQTHQYVVATQNEHPPRAHSARLSEWPKAKSQVRKESQHRCTSQRWYTTRHTIWAHILATLCQWVGGLMRYHQVHWWLDPNQRGHRRLSHPALISEATLNYAIQPSLDEVAKWSADHRMTTKARKLQVLSISNKRAHLWPQLSIWTMNQLQHQRITSTWEWLLTNIFPSSTMLTRLEAKSGPSPISCWTSNDRLLIPQDLLPCLYITCIRPKMKYGGVAWYSILTMTAKDKINILEKLCLKVIEPRSNSYQKRLSALQLVPIDLFTDKLGIEYINQINNPDYCLQRLLSVSAATRSHTTRHRIVYHQGRTTLRNKSLLKLCSEKHLL